MRFVTLSDILRPWKDAGLFHFLSDPALATQADSHEYAEAPAHPTGSLPDSPLAGSNAGEGVFFQAPHHADSSSRASHAPSLHQSAEFAALEGPSSSARPTSAAPRYAQESVTKVSLSGTSLSTPHTPDVGKWPSKWQTQFAKTLKGRFLWTYPELGLDLAGAGSPERSTFLRTLISQLALPKGSSAFWPFALPEDANLVSNISVFNEGLHLLSPAVILYFGRSTLQETLSPASISIPYTQEIVKGQLYVLLPDFDSLTSSSTGLSKTVSFLRQLLPRT